MITMIPDPVSQRMVGTQLGARGVNVACHVAVEYNKDPVPATVPQRSEVAKIALSEVWARLLYLAHVTITHAHWMVDIRTGLGGRNVIRPVDWGRRSDIGTVPIQHQYLVAVTAPGLGRTRKLLSATMQRVKVRCYQL